LLHELKLFGLRVFSDESHNLFVLESLLDRSFREVLVVNDEVLQLLFDALVRIVFDGRRWRRRHIRHEKRLDILLLPFHQGLFQVRNITVINFNSDCPIAGPDQLLDRTEIKLVDDC
jgi:hypothetical protein